MINTIFFVFLILVELTIINTILPEKSNEKSFLCVRHTNILKGIAATMVVCQHIGGNYGTRVFTPLGGIGVSIFLICSAYGLTKSCEKSGLKEYFKKRFSRVLIPYWLIVIAYSIINYKDFNIIIFLKQIVLITTTPGGWFVVLIVRLYILFYLIKRFIPEKYEIYCYFILSFTSLIFTKNNLFAEQSFAFFVGIIFAKNNKNISVKKALKIGITCLIIGGISLILKQLPQVREANYIVMNIIQASLKTVTAVGIIYITYLFLNLRLSNIFIKIGKVSYETYLIHLLILFIIENNKAFSGMIIYLMLCTIGILLFKLIGNKIFSFLLHE